MESVDRNLQAAKSEQKSSPESVHENSRNSEWGSSSKNEWKSSRKLYGLASAVAAISGALGAGALGMWIGVVNLNPVKTLKSEDNWSVIFTNNSRNNLIESLTVVTAVFAVICLAALILMCVMSGNFDRKDGKIRLSGFDKVWTEVQILAAITVASIGFLGIVPIVQLMHSISWNGYYTAVSPDDSAYGVPNTVAVAGCLLLLLGAFVVFDMFFVSMIKKIKAHSFIKSMLIVKLIVMLRTAIVNARQVAMKTNRPVFRYIAVLIGCVCLSATWVGAVLVIALIMIYVPKYVEKYEKLKSGLAEVNSGNLSYEIPVEMDEYGPKTDLDSLAMEINKISRTTDKAVQKELVNQRLKTELISNVSHDIKTPLTSMISYLDILQKEGLDSPDAPAHLEIVIDKTNRLKTLTEDLFEAAKAASGDMPCEVTDINVVSMLEQALVEMEDRFENKKLEIISNYTQEDIRAKADGRLLFRVIENVLGNVSKYSLDGSRVYIDVVDGRDMVQLIVKNISRDQLNVSPEELMERFKRGDESRNTEGSGLGLAIASDLADLMGGEFRIEIDGDMFKSIITLSK